MKSNILKIMMLLISNILLSQTPIISVVDRPVYDNAIPNAYYKDIDNLLNPYEGTYEYVNGTTKLKIKLRKVTMSLYANKYYEDLLIGEFQYIENGVEKVNTLNKFNENYTNQSKHLIDTHIFIFDKNYQLWECPDCSNNETRLLGNIGDISTNTTAELFLRRYTENGIQKLKIDIRNPSELMWLQGQPQPSKFCLPLGDLILTKI